MSVIETVFDGKDLLGLAIDGEPLPIGDRSIEGRYLRLTLPDDCTVARGLRFQAAELRTTTQNLLDHRPVFDRAARRLGLGTRAA